ncbi:uncharacterized protein LOC127286752 [Leptopilina boulardi]|uniref:uncharacterized protein LOC127286752 n=1 Tax=Leptopilina boulardi TaxID=63433 RepID=UPI0021F5592B|nr:uncharacterized protein LOC127286752 [Leptopilina boulardi]
MDENLENECEDLVDELSDMRQRYPAYCSYKLEKCLKLTREINTMDMKTDSIHMSKIEKPLQLDGERRVIYEKYMSNLSNKNSISRKTWKNIGTDLNDLIKIADQLRGEKKSSISHSIKKLTQEKLINS